ncbi:MAG: MotA/TolQ/ExbB proton channel family protein [Mogibacterium sp.]|nr:MotA/TolQ/ExbB proton channel family protein [Mogibacterium sp.]
MSEAVKDVLRVICESLQIPTIVILIIFMAVSVVMLGGIIAEFFTDHRKLKTSIPDLIDTLQGKSSAEMGKEINSAKILKRQKSALIYLIRRVSYPDNTREALARQLIADEEARYRKITKVTDIIARVAPMFGLMGTLIPLGPGLIALGQGDTKTLSDSLLIAFDTTVAGLVTGAISYVISGIRKGWYERYMVALETLMETVLEEQSNERRSAGSELKKGM